MRESISLMRRPHAAEMKFADSIVRRQRRSVFLRNLGASRRLVASIKRRYRGGGGADSRASCL